VHGNKSGHFHGKQYYEYIGHSEMITTSPPPPTSFHNKMICVTKLTKALEPDELFGSGSCPVPAFSNIEPSGFATI
jgi:hypothetical protein